MKEEKERAVIVGHGTSGYGLCFGYTAEEDGVILRRRTVTLQRARHIAYYETGLGGLTTLAVEGPTEKSRIGKPCSVGLAEVLTVLTVTPGAQERFERF